MKRKNLSKKLRFEVFKRDAFKCQYCGSSAPEVVLHVDHIKPVSKGGKNELVNLITSCQDCNQGKGARLLDDKSAIEKQRKQLEELNEKREQLEMMLKWREGLAELKEMEVDAVNDRLVELTGYAFNDHGKKNVEKHIKKFGLSMVLDALDSSFDAYYDKKNEEDSTDKVIKYIPKICYWKRIEKEKPYMKDIFYIRGILKNRVSYCDMPKAKILLEQAYLKGASIESLKELVLEIRTWSAFREKVEEFLEE